MRRGWCQRGAVAVAAVNRVTSSLRPVRVVVYSRITPPAAWITRPFTSWAAGDTRCATNRAT